MRERSWKCKWNLQCRVKRERPQGVHPQRRPRTPDPPAREIQSTLSSKKRRRIYACTIESHESVRKRTKETQSKDHEHHIAERKFNSSSRPNLEHKPVRILPWQSTKSWKNGSTCQHGERRKSKTTKRSSQQVPLRSVLLSPQQSPCLREGVAGLRLANTPHEGLLKVERREFRCLGFRCLGFRF